MPARAKTVVSAVEHELAALRKADPALAEGALALTARKMAEQLDADGGVSATAKSMCAKVLIEAMERLRQLAPVVEEADSLDELASRRITRLAARGSNT